MTRASKRPWSAGCDARKTQTSWKRCSGRWKTLRTGGRWTWKPPSTRDRRGARKISLRGGGNFLGRFLQPQPFAEGVGAQGVQILELDPFDPRLRSHKIRCLALTSLDE